MTTLRAGLMGLGLTPVPSEANFLYFDVHQDGKAVFEALLRAGIIVRHIEGPMLRVTIGLPDENQCFLQALAKVLGQHHTKRRS
jgi:histidinol-phosphate aminotransferase